MREAKGPLVEALRWKTVLLSEIQRDSNPRRWNGKQITIPIFTAPQQGSGMITANSSNQPPGPPNPEGGYINAPELASTVQANIKTGIAAVAVSFSTQAINQAKGDENVWAEVIPTKMSRAEEAFKRIINEQMCGTGDALLAAVTAANAAAVQTVGTTANFYQLYAGRVVTVCKRSDGTSATNATIVDYDEVAGTVTLSATIATDNTYGIYIEGSYGNAIAGIGAATATSGLFQGVNKTNVPAWRGTDVSPGSATDPTLAQLDKAERKAAQKSGRQPDFYIGDPAVIDKFTQGLTVQARWAGDEGQLATGWTGVRYRNKVLVPEFDMPPGVLYGISKEDVAIYTLDDGPDWDDITGSVFQRPQTTRLLTVEAWLVWMLQLGFQACNSFVKLGNMNQAT
jgi:hypothetical protein